MSQWAKPVMAAVLHWFQQPRACRWHADFFQQRLGFSAVSWVVYPWDLPSAIQLFARDSLTTEDSWTLTKSLRLASCLSVLILKAETSLLLSEWNHLWVPWREVPNTSQQTTRRCCDYRPQVSSEAPQDLYSHPGQVWQCRSQKLMTRVWLFYRTRLSVQQLILATPAQT